MTLEFTPPPIPEHLKTPARRRSEFEGMNPKINVEQVGATTISILDVPELAEFVKDIPKDLLKDIPRCPVNKMMVEIITTGNSVLSLPDDNGDWWVIGLYDGRVVKRETREQIFLKQRFILENGPPASRQITFNSPDPAKDLILPDRPKNPRSTISPEPEA